MGARIVGQAIGANHCGRVTQDTAHIFFGDAVVDGSGGPQPLRGFRLSGVPYFCDLGKGLSGDFGVGRAPGDGDFNALVDLPEIERAGCCGVGIAVACSLGFLCCFERGEDFGAATPVVDSGAFEMRDDDGHATLAPDGEGLAHGVKNCFGFTAQVRGVDGARGGERISEGNDFVHCRGVGGEVGEAGAESDGAIVESLIELGAHGTNLGRCRGAVETIHVVVAQGGVSDEGGDVDGGLGFADGSDVRRKGWVTKIARVAEKVHGVGWDYISALRLQCDGRGADSAVAGDDGGDTLGELGKHGRSANDARVVVGVRVNKAGREGETPCVDDRGRVALKRRCDGNDTVATESDVAGLSVCAAAVDDGGFADEDVAGEHAGQIRIQGLAITI